MRPSGKVELEAMVTTIERLGKEFWPPLTGLDAKIKNVCVCPTTRPETVWLHHIPALLARVLPLANSQLLLAATLRAASPGNVA